MPSRTPRIRSELARVLRRHGVTWGELGRRALLPPRTLARLRAPAANPRLAIAERVAAALGEPVEAVWQLVPRRPGRNRA